MAFAEQPFDQALMTEILDFLTSIDEHATGNELCRLLMLAVMGRLG